ncbi:hypothetical protein AHAS_Ahas20G0179600 [Arachis hypogaea]
MAAARRVTIQEAGALDFSMQPFQAHHPAVATDFEIKTALLNLMPKFHRLPAQEPIKHLRDFQAACSTVCLKHGIPSKLFSFMNYQLCCLFHVSLTCLKCLFVLSF